MSPPANQRTFASLSTYNYRLYVIGQIVSLAGTWLQSVALGWLVLVLTGSGTKVGLVVAAQTLPVLLFGAWGGLLADRLDKHRLAIATQSLAALQALALGIMTMTGSIHLWTVYVLAAVLGMINAVDNPTRQTFVAEMVGPELLPNAVTLNTVTMNAARVIGPALAGIMIETIGIGPCFIANAGSFIAVIVALALMRRSELRPAQRMMRGRGQVRAGLRYVWANPSLRVMLVLMAVIGTFTYEFQVNLPLVAKYTFNGDAGTYAWLTGAMGAGAVVGGLLAAGRARYGADVVVRSSLTFGLVIVLAALAPTELLAIVALLFVGSLSVTFIARAASTLQLQADPEMRGRVMALWTVAFIGSTPIGGPIIGWVSEHANPRVGLGLSGVAAIGGGLGAWLTLRARTRAEAQRVALAASQAA